MSPSGALNEAQFLQFMEKMKSKVATAEEIVDALSVFDSSANKDGYVDTTSLKHAMFQMGQYSLLVCCLLWLWLLLSPRLSLSLLDCYSNFCWIML